MKHPQSKVSGVIHVACAADSHFLPHCAAMLHSLLAHHPDAQIHFLCGAQMTTETLAPLAAMVCAQGGAFKRHEIPAQQLENLPRLRQIPALMWYRIYLPELLPDQPRVLYLDADTLVVDDLSELWATPLDDNYLAAVTNVLPAAAHDWPRSLGLDAASDYFNSGVLLLNLDALRDAHMAAELAAFGRTRGAELKWPDQDALNALLWRRRRALHPRWNCQNSFYYWRASRQLFAAGEVAEAVSNPTILHFEGGHLGKPWHYLNRHPRRELYFEHRRQTPWPTVKLEGRRRGFGLLRVLPTRWTVALLWLYYRTRAALRGRGAPG